MAISRRLRFEILRRDGFTCSYCGGTPPDVKLTVDHLIPEALGGTDAPENLVAACQPCNAGKASTGLDAPHVAAVRQDALRWRDAMLHCAYDADADRQARDQDRAAFETNWLRWTWSDRGEERPFRLPLDWPLAIDRFHAAGLTREDIADYIDICMRTDWVRDRFRYFARLSWNEINSRQTAVSALLSEADH